MTFLTRHLKQTATYWAVSGVDSFGDASFTSPTALLVRWEDRTEMFINADGKEEKSKAVIFLSIDIKLGDYIYLGTSVVSDPTTVDGAHIIKNFSKIPGLGGDKFERRAIV